MSVVPVRLYPTIRPLPGRHTYPVINHGGHHTQSLGGGPGRDPLPSLSQPFLFSTQMLGAYDPVHAAGSAHRLFQDISPATLTAGTVLYRGVYIDLGESETLVNLACYLSQPASDAEVAIQSAGKNTVAARLANETTSPGGSFSTPTSGAKLTISSSFGATDYVVLWVKYTITAGTAAYPYDVWSLTFTADDYAPRTFYFYNNLLAGVTITSVTSNRTGSRTRQGIGETFTVLTKNGSAVLADPGQNAVYVRITAPLLYSESSPGLSTATGLCSRTSAGTYTFQWRPDVPGFHTLVFDIGEHHYHVDRNVV